MRLSTHAIVLALRNHGEHGAVVRLLTPADGMVAAYVRGARGRRLRPVLIPGNEVEVRLSARTDGQLPQAELEPTLSRAPLMSEPVAAAAILWSTALTAQVLPERQPYPALHAGLTGLLDAIVAAPAASGWGPALLRFEMLILAELGFGLQAAELDQAVADWRTGLKLSGRRIRRDLLDRPDDPTWDARERLTQRLRRAAGLVA